jgi:hypothetical protein
MITRAYTITIRDCVDRAWGLERDSDRVPVETEEQDSVQPGTSRNRDGT